MERVAKDAQTAAAREAAIERLTAINEVVALRAQMGLQGSPVLTLPRPRHDPSETRRIAITIPFVQLRTLCRPCLAPLSCGSHAKLQAGAPVPRGP